MKSYKHLFEENLDWAKETFEKLNKKAAVMAVRSRDKIADGVDENGMHVSTVPHDWTSGFWGGMNAMLYEYTKNEEYLKTAKNIEKKIDVALADYPTLHHDVGFMWHILSGVLYRVTGDNDSRVRDLFASSSLASRYVLNGGFIRAWNSWTGSTTPAEDCNYDRTIVDCMMNIPMLYWASREIGDDRFKQVAMAHADMTMRDHVRDDGSVVHIVDHDRESATVVRTLGGQGYEVGSSWSRGQGWALYGFALSYIHTGEKRYLDTAKRVANYFIANCCDDWLPRVDFRSPEEPVLYDATAGAIAACGLIELGKRLPEYEGGMYMHAAIKILRAMTESFCDFDESNDHILGFGTALYPINEQESKRARLHSSIIYGDYFYTEAILKLVGSEFLPW